MVELTLADGSVITATDHHPVWSATSRHFRNAVDLLPGEELQRADGTLITLATVRVRSETLIAYNLAIDGVHTYYVGTTPLLVHNDCGPRNKLGQFISAAGGESAATAAGRAIHDRYSGVMQALGHNTTYVTRDGRRPDALDTVNRVVHELKSDAPGSQAAGRRQAASYAKQLELETGRTWTWVLDTYSR